MREMLDRLLDERGKAVKGFRDFIDPITAEKRDMTAEEGQEWSRRNQELDVLDERVAQMHKRVQGDEQVDQYRAEAEARLKSDPKTPRASADLSADPTSVDARVLEWARGGGSPHLDVSLRGLKVDDVTNQFGEHRKVVRESRALDVGTATSGGDLVPVSFRTVLYQHLIMTSAVRQTRATVLTTSSGEQILMPKTTAHPAKGSLIAEGGTISESDPTFGNGTLQAYKYANLIPVSTELLQDTGVDLLGYLAMAMGRALGIGSGADFMLGAGTAGPEGIITGAGTVAQYVGGTGQAGVPTYKELEAVYDNIIPPYQTNGEWVFSQKMVSSLRSLTDTLGRPLWVPSLSGGMPDTLLGKPFFLDPAIATPAVNAVSMVFGDWSPFFIRDVDGLRFERSLDFGFNTDMVYYRAIIRTDSRLLDKTGAVATYKGGTA